MRVASENREWKAARLWCVACFKEEERVTLWMLLMYKTQLHQSIRPVSKDSGSYRDRSSDRFPLFGRQGTHIWTEEPFNCLIVLSIQQVRFSEDSAELGSGSFLVPPPLQQPSVPALFSKAVPQATYPLAWHQWEIQGIWQWTFSLVQRISESKSVVLKSNSVSGLDYAWFNILNLWKCRVLNYSRYDMVWYMIWTFCFNPDITAQVKHFYYPYLFSC